MTLYDVQTLGPPPTQDPERLRTWLVRFMEFVRDQTSTTGLGAKRNITAQKTDDFGF